MFLGKIRDLVSQPRWSLVHGLCAGENFHECYKSRSWHGRQKNFSSQKQKLVYGISQANF